MITRMMRYDFILLSSENENFLPTLQELGVVDIERSSKAIDEKSAAMLAECDALKKRISMLEKENFPEDEAYASILAEIKLWNTEAAIRRPFGEFDPGSFAFLAESGRTMRFYSASKKKFDPAWEETWPMTIVEDDGSTVWFAAVVEKGEAGPDANEIALKGDLSEAEAKIAGLEADLEERRAELLAEKENTKSLKAELATRLAGLDSYFADAAKESAAEELLTLYTGFAPVEEKEKLVKAFDAMDVYYTVSDAAVEDNPPIKFRNNRFVKMFEVLTDMYGRPKYDGFDPTPFISIFFLLFFAMCVGDAGYGIVLVAIGLLLKKAKGFASLAPLVVTLGVGTIVVGFFFHTFFSMDISKWACIPDGLKKVMVPATVAGYDGTMVLALVVGVIHLLLAMIVKTVYATKNKGFLESLSTWGWTLFWVGLVVIAVIALAGVLDSSVTKWAIIILGIVCAIGIFPLNNIHRNPLVNVGSGLWDTYNMATGILGDVLSYLRLYALGLAGAMLGFAFNDLGVMARGDGGVVGWIAFILIVVIGHTLNIAMAALGAFVHPLRLNFLEFFKNSDYDGSGRKYNPLKK
ncbi:MAG: hypothetical protein MJY56_08405 [Bacteroidales bacterium]|nr:hypothetical protein [Bacteroidales bacterium]